MRLWSKLGAVVVVALGASPVAAQNLLLNGEFDFDVSLWTVSASPGSVTWSAQDHQGGTGSALLASTDPGTLANKAITQCRPAHAGDTYDTRAWYFIPSGQGATGYGQLFVNWFDSDTCLTSPLSGVGAPIVTTLDTWEERQILDQIAPAGTIAARVFLQLTKSSAGTFQLHTDGARLIPHPFFADGFESGDTTGWSLAVP